MSKPSFLPSQFGEWFSARGWLPRPHQLALTKAGLAGRSALLVAPTGGGKTLAGFLASLIQLAAEPSEDLTEDSGSSVASSRGLHTLYISPLKALAVDVHRNLQSPIEEMGLPVRVETRTGDTPQNRRKRQRHSPPDILMTTPEQLALLLSYEDAASFFGTVQCVILDELHALTNSKRGDLLALGLARLSTLAPDHRRIGLSATVAEPDHLRRYLLPQPTSGQALADLVIGEKGAIPKVSILVPTNSEPKAPTENSDNNDPREVRIPWSGHSAKHALQAVYDQILQSQTVLVFVNTRSQAEFVFQQLWHLNEDALPIALHHGSLSVEQRRKVEAAMSTSSLRAVVCTSTLDLGIDWGAVDLVINMGAPKGASRLLQRIGRANHKLDTPSQAWLVPANRFEVLECEAARQAAINGVHDGVPEKQGSLDVLAQHIWGRACSGPFHPDDLFTEVCSAAPYRSLNRTTFDEVVAFVATGGYALKQYDRYRKLQPVKDLPTRIGENLSLAKQALRLAHPSLAQAYRLNVGTIVSAPMMKVRMIKRRLASGAPPRGGRVLGEMEEYFLDQLVQGDTFLFAGHIVRFEGMYETDALVTKTQADNPAIPAYYGGKFPLSTYLAAQVRHILATPAKWQALPAQVAEWLQLQQWRSVLPAEDELLVETFPRGDKFYLVCYPFEGRLAHQTLGMLLTRRLDRLGARPLGFVASEYSLAIWGLRDVGLMFEQGNLSLADLFDEDMMGDDLEAWLAESSLMKRSFRDCAVIAGLIERRLPGKEKTGRQVTFSSDLIYDVLREHEPDHVLLKAAWEDAAHNLVDSDRVSELLARTKGHIVLKRLERVSPLAVPVLLDIGREAVYGEANEELLAEAADNLIEEATRLV